LSSAGHPAPALVRAGGDVELVGPRGTLLGVLDDVELAQETITLDAGDALVFYTDGVTERRRGEIMFGDHNLLECLRTVAGQSAEAIAEYLDVQVRRFGAARDDLAVLVVRATGHTD
jgi:serine phosphatase RsbU (regulator of sigma subunit)